MGMHPPDDLGRGKELAMAKVKSAWHVLAQARRGNYRKTETCGGCV